MNKYHETQSVLVGYDCTNGVDKSTLIVGQKKPNKPIKILNSFFGKEAEELWNKLTRKPNGGEGHV